MHIIFDVLIVFIFLYTTWNIDFYEASDTNKLLIAIAAISVIGVSVLGEILKKIGKKA